VSLVAKLDVIGIKRKANATEENATGQEGN
jgi:hypothetical protein